MKDGSPTFGHWYDFRQRPPFAERYEGFYAECLEEIEEGERLGSTGTWPFKYHFVDDGYLPLASRPRGKVSICIGALAESAIERAARVADGFVASAVGGAFGKTCRTLWEALARHGRAGEDSPFVASATLYVHEDAARARAEVAPAISCPRSRYAEWGTGVGEPKPEPTRPEDLPWEGYFVGGKDEVAEDLSQICQGASYDHLCFWGRLPGPSHEQSLKFMRHFASEVAPKVRETART